MTFSFFTVIYMHNALAFVVEKMFDLVFYHLLLIINMYYEHIEVF